MLRLSSLLLFCFCQITICKANNFYHDRDTSAILGRWDITVKNSKNDFPSWLEIIRSGNHGLVGYFVASGGSARPVSRIFFENGKLSFGIPPQWESGTDDLKFEATLQGDSLVGTMVFPNGKTFSCSAVHAPSLVRNSLPVWGKPTPLLHQNDLKGWHTTGENQWLVEKGILKSSKPGSNIITDATFTDFKLHVEFRYAVDGNSGVYLRGRYEVQIEDNAPGTAGVTQLGAVYGFLPASGSAGKKAGEWQSYDITLVGRMVTVVLNGTTIICNREIPGITGGALDSREAQPGPIMLQGDHEPIEFRNIVITPAK
jgi:hypothetical protein